MVKMVNFVCISPKLKKYLLTDAESYSETLGVLLDIYILKFTMAFKMKSPHSGIRQR